MNNSIQQKAIIKLNFSLLELQLIKTIPNASLDTNINKINVNSLLKYLNEATEQLYNSKFINDKPIPISFISEIYPFQITVSITYDFNITKLKELQNILIKNGFKIKFSYK